MTSRPLLALLLAFAIAGPTVGDAQDATLGSGAAVQLADRGPIFFAALGGRRAAIDVRATSIFRERVSLHLANATVADALAAVSRQSGLQFIYDRDALPKDARTSISADQLTIASALNEILLDAGLDVEVAGDRFITLVPHGAAGVTSGRRQPGTGTIMGRVTDRARKTPLSAATVRVEGTTLGATTGADGKYTIISVPLGAYHLTARRVGYTPLTEAVRSVADSVAAADFALNPAPTKLNEVVTTAVGDQRRYEVGTTIATINADSIAPTAPITSLTDLMSARAPGVEVVETSGMAGAGEAIRIRGLSSLVLQNDPILIVDGVRQDNSPGGNVAASLYNVGTHPTPTRLNDIDFNDIASIDVLKGPSASTEYGTDAANGVIVITTKRGAAGAPHWRISGEHTTNAIPEHFPNGYYSWGHTTSGTPTAVECPLVPGALTAGYGRTAGNCAVDSVTQWNPLNHDATSIFGTGERQKYDLSVTGGSGAVRYFVAGGLSNETGMIQVPSVFRQLADTAGLGLPSSAFGANREQQRSVRVNTAITAGPTADLTATGSYLSTYQQTPDAGYLQFGVLGSPALRDPAHYYGYNFAGFSASFTPLGELTAVGSQNTDRATGGLTANWRPVAWFVGGATAGLDHGSQRNQILNYPLAKALYQAWPSFLGIVSTTTDVYSVDLRGTVTTSLTHALRTATSAGVQMADTRTAGQSASSTGITTTNLTLNGATGVTVAQIANRQATLGGYGEEELGVADRLFVTGAVRVDAGSGFGRSYATAAYPKASISWLAISQGPTTVRVRGAFGESGVQPVNGAASRLYGSTVAYLGGTTVTAYPLNWPGNSTLRPERSEELEGGVDIGGWGNRLSLELTGYSKITRDALVNISLGGDLCCSTFEENIGRVRNTGVEGTVTAGLLQTRSLTWTVTVNASANRNRLVSLAPDVRAQLVSGGGLLNYRQAPGYPLYGIWAPRVMYADANHDGIIEANEVTLADSATYVGPSQPTREASITTHIDLWRGAVTVGGLADYRGGYRIANLTGIFGAFAERLPEQNDPTAPLWLQARAIENATTFGLNALDAEDGTFVRVRELSVTYAVPVRLVRALRVQNVTVTGAVRNLALWTRYRGIDPEVSNWVANIQSSPTAGGFQVNNDVRSDFGAVPLPRSWVVRLNVGL